MSDTFGNFVVQKVLEKGNAKHKDILFQEMKGKIVELSNG